MGTRRDRVRRVVGRRGMAMVALVPAALTALIVAPAPSASAGHNSTGIKVHNRTSAATLVMTDGIVDFGSSSRQVWEDKKGPWDHPVIAPHTSAHYELITQSDYQIRARLLYNITVDGQKVGQVTVWTYVNGKWSFPYYGEESTECTVAGPFACRVTGSDTATVTDQR